MELFLHIGLPKTGTTALQQHFFPAMPGISFNNEGLLRIFVGLVDLQSFGMLEPAHIDAVRDLLERLEHEVEPDLKVLISLEHLSWGLGTHDYRSRAQLLARVFPRAHILATLRHQVPLARSTWLQALQLGATSAPEDYFGLEQGGFQELDLGAVARRAQARLSVPEFMDFGRLHEAFVESFGPQQVHLFFFEAFPRLALLGHRMAATIDPMVMRSALPQRLINSNISISAEAVEMFQQRLQFLQTFGVAPVNFPVWHSLRHGALEFRHWLEQRMGRHPEPVPSYDEWGEFHFAQPHSRAMARALPRVVVDRCQFRTLVQDRLAEAAQKAQFPLRRYELPAALQAAMADFAAQSNQRLAERLGPGLVPEAYLEPTAQAA